MQKGFSLVLIIVVAGLLVVVGAGGYWWYQQQKINAINSFDDCVKIFGSTKFHDHFECLAPGKGFSVPLNIAPPQLEVSVSASLKNPGWERFEWNTDYGGDDKFSIEYPKEWYREGRVLYPEGRVTKFFISLGAGGHGLPHEVMQKIITKTFNGENAQYYWGSLNDSPDDYAFASFEGNGINYIFEARYIPKSKSNQYQKIFLKMLNTFEKVK